jgi:hypothetical protein
VARASSAHLSGPWGGRLLVRRFGGAANSSDEA